MPGCSQRYKTQPGSLLCYQVINNSLVKAMSCFLHTGLKYHMSNGHTEGKPLRSYLCESCGRAFESEELQRLHRSQHVDTRPTCTNCNHQFARLASLVRHYAICKSEFQYWYPRRTLSIFYVTIDAHSQRAPRMPRLGARPPPRVRLSRIVEQVQCRTIRARTNEGQSSCKQPARERGASATLGGCLLLSATPVGNSP